MKKYYMSSEGSGAPLSGAIEANGFVYVSGQIHVDQDWNIIGESIEEKFVVIMNRIEVILSEANLTKNDIIRIHIYLTNISDLPKLNNHYIKYINHPMPARTVMEVSALPLGANLEIDVIASK